jgi:integral membrane sensor domain MASE1
MALFLGLSFVVMSWVPYGVSLRFATYWDVPLRWLALTQAILLISELRKIRPAIALACLLCLICASDLWQYNVYFVKAKLYDPITTNLVYAAGLTKKMPKSDDLPLPSAR